MQSDHLLHDLGFIFPPSQKFIVHIRLIKLLKKYNLLMIFFLRCSGQMPEEQLKESLNQRKILMNKFLYPRTNTTNNTTSNNINIQKNRNN